jgi:heme exporter protein C
MNWALVFGVLGFILVTIGHGMGIFVAPKEAMMGDVGRILYVHVPTAWVALLTYLIAFIQGIGSLWTGKKGWDASLEATLEVGVLLNVLLTIQGSIWARPTWGVWWTWDPRLTTTSIMVFSFLGVLLLRRVLSSDDPERRAVLTAVGSIVAFINVPIVYFSVKWWRSLHQNFSSPETVSSSMVTPLRIAAFGMLFLMISMIIYRAKIALLRLEKSSGELELPPIPNHPLDITTKEATWKE